MPGLNDWAIEKASKCRKVPLQNGMDGTRIVRAIELRIPRQMFIAILKNHLLFKIQKNSKGMQIK